METCYSPGVQNVLNKLQQRDRNTEAAQLITVCRHYLTVHYPELLTIENFSTQQLEALKKVCNQHLFAPECTVSADPTEYKPEPLEQYPCKNKPEHTKHRNHYDKKKRKAAEASRRRNRK